MHIRFKPQRGVKSVAAWAFIQLLSLSSVVGDSVRTAVVFSGVAVSGAEDGSVSVLSDCAGSGVVAAGSDAVVLFSAGELPGVVGAVGAVGSAVTVLSGGWVLLCCEPVAVISPSFVIEFVLSLTAQLPHFGVRVICVPAAAFTVKVNVLFTKICSV